VTARGTRPPRIALSGAGSIATAHGIAATAIGAQVVHVASRRPERATRLAGDLGASAVTYAELPGSADIVVVATPPGCHTADTIDYLDAGAVVLVEKPMCRTLAEADALVAHVRRHGGRLVYGENLVYAPVVRAFLTAARQVTGVNRMEVRAIQGRPTTGPVTGDARYTDDWGGGALFDLGAHPVALAMMLGRAVGAGDVVGVSGVLEGSPDHDTDEHAELDLHFASGVRGRVTSSWRAGPAPLWDAQVSAVDTVVRAEILPVPNVEVNGEPQVLAPSRSALPKDVRALENFGIIDELRAAVTLAAADTNDVPRPVSDVEFGREVLEVICAGYASAADQGSEVEVPFRGPRNRTPLALWRAR
jgi:predicted dehydrogenase